MFEPYVKMIHKILILGQNSKRFLTKAIFQKIIPTFSQYAQKYISTPGQYAYAYAKLILSWDKLSWPQV
jgi:hypothetical protein